MFGRIQTSQTGGQPYSDTPSYFVSLDSDALLMLNYKQIYMFGLIQTSQTGGHPYSDPSPYKVCEYFLLQQTSSLT